MVSPCRNRSRRLSGEKKSFGWRPAVRELSLRFRARQGCLVSPAWRPTLFAYGPMVRITRSIPIKNQGDSQYLLADNGKSLVPQGWAERRRQVQGAIGISFDFSGTPRADAVSLPERRRPAQPLRLFGVSQPSRRGNQPSGGTGAVVAPVRQERHSVGNGLSPVARLSSCLVPDALLPCPTSGLH